MLSLVDANPANSGKAIILSFWGDDTGLAQPARCVADDATSTRLRSRAGVSDCVLLCVRYAIRYQDQEMCMSRNSLSGQVVYGAVSDPQQIWRATADSVPRQIWPWWATEHSVASPHQIWRETECSVARENLVAGVTGCSVQDTTGFCGKQHTLLPARF